MPDDRSHPAPNHPWLSDIDRRKLRDVFQSKSACFSDLVKAAGLSPTTDFRFADLTSVDFSGSDIRGYDFTGTDLSGTRWFGATWDDTTILADALMIGAKGFKEANANERGRRATTLFERFFHGTPMAVAIVDKNGKIGRRNSSFIRLFGEFLSGLPLDEDGSILSVVLEHDRPALDSAIRKASEGQSDISPVDAALAGSHERWAQFFVSPVEGKENEAEAAIVYAIDTTQQRTLESQVNQQQKMETIGRLAGNIAHDFNNVLGAIMMATDFLLNSHEPTDPSFRDIMQIKQNANRGASVVRQLLAFSRKQTLRPQVIDLGEALSDLMVLLRRLIGENVTLDVPQVRDLWPVRTDVGQFEQVIINLAVNARDAMPFGGKLALRTSNVGINDSVALQQYKGIPLGEYVLVEVEDTGSGIAPDIIDKIFDPFYTTKDVGKGTGLGLSTVYGIIKQSGGFIYVESAVGKGTTFRIFLPRYNLTTATSQAPPVHGTTRPRIAGTFSSAEMNPAAIDLTGEGTILLVEDEQGLRALNARGLQSRGYKVIEAGNGVEALEQFEMQDGQIDLVVSNVMMPEMDGPTLLKVLRERNPSIRLIFMSGYAADAFAKNLPDGDEPTLLAKPFTLRQLLVAVKQAIAVESPTN